MCTVGLHVSADGPALFLQYFLLLLPASCPWCWCLIGCVSVRVDPVLPVVPVLAATGDSSPESLSMAGSGPAGSLVHRTGNVDFFPLNSKKRNYIYVYIYIYLFIYFYPVVYLDWMNVFIISHMVF